MREGRERRRWRRRRRRGEKPERWIQAGVSAGASVCGRWQD